MRWLERAGATLAAIALAAPFAWLAYRFFFVRHLPPDANAARRDRWKDPAFRRRVITVQAMTGSLAILGPPPFGDLPFVGLVSIWLVTLPLVVLAYARWSLAWLRRDPEAWKAQMRTGGPIDRPAGAVLRVFAALLPGVLLATAWPPASAAA